ncbi:hypothetical protein N182_13625 [Sinorhizobium sp. GL2]|nr:hypothetical protein N182_13625 [Sinorhizobium sp. GL2]
MIAETLALLATRARNMILGAIVRATGAKARREGRAGEGADMTEFFHLDADGCGASIWMGSSMITMRVRWSRFGDDVPPQAP